MPVYLEPLSPWVANEAFPPSSVEGKEMPPIPRCTTGVARPPPSLQGLAVAAAGKPGGRSMAVYGEDLAVVVDIVGLVSLPAAPPPLVASR